MFIRDKKILNIFRASLCPSSGEQDCLRLRVAFAWLLSGICTEATFLPSHVLVRAMLQFNNNVKLLKLTQGAL
jgi:hypothetical protein